MVENARQQIKISTVTGEVATVPLTNDHNDGSWLTTDVYKGEFFYNAFDKILQLRAEDNTIHTINTGGGSDCCYLGVVTTESDRTFELTDVNKIIRLTGATDRIFTVPLNSSVAFPLGSQILIERFGVAELDIAEAVGITINSADNFLSLNKQGSGAVLVKVGTDEWSLFGDLKL